MQNVGYSYVDLMFLILNLQYAESNQVSESTYCVLFKFINSTFSVYMKRLENFVS